MGRAKTAQELGPYGHPPTPRHTDEQLRLLRVGQRGDPLRQHAVVRSRRHGRTVLRGSPHEVRVQPQELGKGLERSREGAQSRRNRRLQLVIFRVPALYLEQPAKVERAMVAARDLVAQRQDG